MKRIFIIFALLILAKSFAVSQTENKNVAQNSSFEQEIIKLERERLDAYARADREAFNRIVADDFTMTHSDGGVFDKAQERDVLRPSTASRPLPALIIEDIRVRAYGDAAVITGRLVEQGERVGRVSLHFTNTYVRRQGRWQIVAGQLTRLPQERPPTTNVNVSPNVLDTYVGQYELAPNLIITITKDGNRLMSEVGGRKSELTAQSETQFSIPSANIKVTFVKDANGQVTHLIINDNGREGQAKRIR